MKYAKLLKASNSESRNFMYYLCLCGRELKPLLSDLGVKEFNAFVTKELPITPLMAIRSVAMFLTHPSLQDPRNPVVIDWMKFVLVEIRLIELEK